MREDFYLYPLKGHPHFILGVQWFVELGDIHTNYQNLTMRFEMGGVEHTLQGLKDEEALKSNNRLELAGWASREMSCMGKPRRPMLRLLDDQGITGRQEESRGATLHPWDNGGPTLQPDPLGGPMLGRLGVVDCTTDLGEAGAPIWPMREHGGTALESGPPEGITLGVRKRGSSMLSLGMVGDPTQPIQSFWNPTLVIGEAIAVELAIVSD